MAPALSGGEQQRLSLALALAGAPDVLFLDEPTASVDVAGRQQVRALLRSLRDGGCCIVLTTHELEGRAVGRLRGHRGRRPARGHRSPR